MTFTPETPERGEIWLVDLDLTAGMALVCCEDVLSTTERTGSGRFLMEREDRTRGGPK